MDAKTRRMRMSAQQCVRLADCLLDEMERSPRPKAVVAWGVQYLARKAEQSIYVVEAELDPLVQVEKLAMFAEVAIKQAYADGKDEDDIRDAVIDALVRLMEMLPARGLNLRAREVVVAARAAAAASSRR